MIEYSDISKADVNGIQLVVHGDDTSTTIHLNLSKPPFDINFNGNLPNEFELSGVDEGITAAATIAPNEDGDNILTVTYSEPPPAPSEISSGTEGLNVEFIYPSVT